MQNIPQIVRERLKAGAPVPGHPDVDVLTAFLEQSLSAGERMSVLEHLARCGECRDVIALALPETEAIPPVRVPSHVWWLTWPAFRWAFVTAGVAIVAVGVVQYQRLSHKPKATMMARQNSPTERIGTDLQSPPSAKAELPAKPEAGKPEKDASGPPLGVAAANKAYVQLASPKGSDEEKRSLSAAVPAPPVRAPVGALGGPAAYGLKQETAQLRQQQQVPSRVQALQQGALAKREAGNAAAIPPSSQTVEVQVESEAPAVSVEAQKQDIQKAPLPTPKAAEQLFDSLQSAPVTKTKPATEAAVSLPAPRWSISATGSLQRSFDGNTWQDVDVNASSTLVSEYAYSSTSPDLAVAKGRVKEKAADKKTMRKEQATTVFRAVTAVGVEVWAGGSNATLYHSVDAGNRWTRVVPASGGTLLTGDVVALDFSDAQRGTVTTSTAEVWITVDNGKTWQKQ